MTDLFDLTRLEARALRLIEAARRAGADAADAVAMRGLSQEVAVRLGAVESAERAEGDEFGLRVFVGKRTASVSANAVDDVAALAERAVAMARLAPEDPYVGLADPALLVPPHARPELDLLDPATPSADVLAAEALAAEAAVRAVPGVTNSGGAGAWWRFGGFVLATSDGFSGGYVVSRHGRSVTAIAGSGTAMERDYDASARTHRDELDAPDLLGRRAGERAVRRLNPRKVPSGPATVVYEPRAATSLLGHFVGAINGAGIARGTSFLKRELGKPVFAPGIRITDDPLRRRGLASAPFDGEGTASAPIDLIADGVLTTWLLDSASARELDLVPNGRASRGAGQPSPSASNVTLHPGPLSPDALLRQIGTGLYVTDLIGHGANGVTGDYSRGASGFWIENGELAYPVSEITIAGNLRQMFARLTPASDLEERFAFMTPTVAIEGLTIAGR